MKKVLCAVIIAAAASGTADAAGGAMAELTLLRTAEEQQAPRPEQASVAGTLLDENTIQGEYLLETNDIPVKAVFKNGAAELVISFPGTGGITCVGAYSLDVKKSTLLTDVPDCGGSKFSHTMYLEGQTVETLMAGVVVRGDIKMDGDITPGVPVKLQKVK